MLAHAPKEQGRFLYHLSGNSCSLLSLSGPSHRFQSVIFKPRKNHANLSTPVSGLVLSVFFGLMLHPDGVDLIPVTEATAIRQMAIIISQ